MGIFDTKNKAKGDNNQQGGAFGRQEQGTITKTAPAMTAGQKQAALDYAASKGGMTIEWNIIKNLNIDVPNPISGVASVVNKVLDLISHAKGA